MLVSGIVVSLSGNLSLTSRWWPPTDAVPCLENEWGPQGHTSWYIATHKPQEPRNTCVLSRGSKDSRVQDGKVLRPGIYVKVRIFVSQGQVRIAR